MFSILSKKNRASKDSVQIEFEEIKDRMRVLDEHAGVGLWQAVLHNGDAVHPQSRWTWSPEFRRLCGFAGQSEFPDVVGSWADRLHADDVEGTFKKFNAHLADKSGRTSYDAVYRLKIRDGSYRWFRATGGCSRGPNGEPMRACGSLVDIHEQKVAEAANKLGAEEQSRVLAEVAEGLHKLGEGKLQYRLTQNVPAQYKPLQDDFNLSLEKLMQTMQSLRQSVQAISSGTAEIMAGSDEMARRTEQQAANLEETAAALDEITATVRKTAEGATHARDVVSSASADAERSGVVVRQAIDAMNGIEKSAKQISQIIGVIDEIAFQTNLLALNAGVEAARAGEAGRGFAVVASEVRALAQRSAEAAKEIKGLISASTTQVDQGVKLVGETGKSLERIVVQVADINTIVSTIAASAQEQSTGLHQVNTTVNQMDQVTQQNAAMVEESTASAHALGQETEELGRLIGRFQIESAAHVEQRRRAPVRAPAPAVGSRPALKTTSPRGGGAARKPQPEAAAEDWTEF